CCSAGASPGRPHGTPPKRTTPGSSTLVTDRSWDVPSPSWSPHARADGRAWGPPSGPGRSVRVWLEREAGGRLREPVRTTRPGGHRVREAPRRLGQGAEVGLEPGSGGPEVLRRPRPAAARHDVLQQRTRPGRG